MCLYRLYIKVAELNTLSDGKEITGIHSAVFLMRWKIKSTKGITEGKLQFQKLVCESLLT